MSDFQQVGCRILNKSDVGWHLQASVQSKLKGVDNISVNYLRSFGLHVAFVSSVRTSSYSIKLYQSEVCRAFMQYVHQNGDITSITSAL